MSEARRTRRALQTDHDMTQRASPSSQLSSEDEGGAARSRMAQPPGAGDLSCPCLDGENDKFHDIHEQDLPAAMQESEQNPAFNVDEYGIGCAAHDSGRDACADTSDCMNIFPVPADCDRSWCTRKWCYVDPANCALLNKRSQMFPNSDRYYSYATCHDMDLFTNSKRIANLAGMKLRAGYNSNSGGWMGAYSRPDGTHFEGPADRWHGPAVDFVHEASTRGNFQIELMPPPPFLANNSIEFFSPSKFDFCVYATALGYLDLCVSQYSITDQRAMSTNWFLLSSDPLYLIVMNEEQDSGSWDGFLSSFSTIFKPFTANAWLFLLFFVIPVMGALFVVHEFGRTGSSYPNEVAVMVKEENSNKNVGADTGDLDDDDDSHELHTRRINPIKHLPKAIYITFLSVMQQAYIQSVVSYGAMFNLLGLSFFILTIIAVYTANLAAILTQQALHTEVDGIESAIRAGYSFCGERKVVSSVMELYNIQERFVPDPIDLGGDGEPGFNCPNCRSRVRVFDYMASKDEADGSLYCNAAIAPLEDLEVLQRDNLHCNKTFVGVPVAFVQSGLPVYDGVSQEVISLMLQMKNDGVYEQKLKASRPVSACPRPEDVEEGEGESLTITQLTGIWVVTFGFAFVGLLITFCALPGKKRVQRWSHKRKSKSGAALKKVKQLGRRDQFGAMVHYSDPKMPSLRKLVKKARRASEAQPAIHSIVEAARKAATDHSEDGDSAHEPAVTHETWANDQDIESNAFEGVVVTACGSLEGHEGPMSSRQSVSEPTAKNEQASKYWCKGLAVKARAMNELPRETQSTQNECVINIPEFGGQGIGSFGAESVNNDSKDWVSVRSFFTANSKESRKS